jgi:hypothetical protein
VKGLWLLPTRKRIEKLKRFFEVPPTTPGVLLVQSAELAEMASAYSSISLPANWKILPTSSDGLGDKCREVWSAVSKLDWVGLGCDDLRPQTTDWDKKLIAEITGRNIVTCDDGVQHDSRMSGITVFSGAVLRAMGYMFPPEFWHTYVDNVWEDIGRGASCWTYVPDVLVTHDHPFTNQKLDPAKCDDTSYKSYGQQERDIQAYKRWCANEKEAVIKRVKEMVFDKMWVEWG